MNINGTEYNPMINGMEKYIVSNKSEENSYANIYENLNKNRNINETVDQPVQVIISEEGMEYYRNSIQETGDTESYDEMISRRNKLLEANLSTDLDYNFQLGGEVNKYKQEGVYLSTKEKAENLLKAYANLYDKIVQGYDNGSREIHVEDKNSEKGYRVLTKEEEINALNDSFKNYADYLEVQAKLEPSIQKGLEEYRMKLARIGIDRPSRTQSHSDNLVVRDKEDISPENLSNRLVEASKLFVKQYFAMSGNLMQLQDMLKHFTPHIS